MDWCRGEISTSQLTSSVAFVLMLLMLFQAYFSHRPAACHQNS